MIHATMFETIAEVKVSGEPSEFEKDLETVRDSIDKADRTFDSNRKVWIVKNPARYKHVSFIATALEERKRQPTLF